MWTVGRASAVATLGLLLAAPVAQAQMPSMDPRIVQLVRSVSEERLATLVETLAAFETRNTLSSTDHPTRGIGAAREWMLEELRSYSPRLEVSFDRHVAPQGGRMTRETDLRNVMAVLPGRSPRRIYVSGHYDTVAGGPDDPAPGANDDGSGTALTMELARVFAQSELEFDATLVFIGFAGEEQGLVGSRLHAEAAREADVRIDAVFNNDIVGNVLGGDGVAVDDAIRVFSEGPVDSPSRQLARYIRRFGHVYVPNHEVRLIAREDRFGRGGDHTPFNRAGYAAVRFTEVKENYARQHTPADTPDGVDPRYLAQNARVNAGAVASLALAPPAPVVTPQMLGRGPSRYDAHLRWQPSPGAEGYRIVWRDTWTMDWQHEIVVGNVAEHLIPDMSIDDFVFGVAAIGPGGHESLVSAYVRPPR